MKYFGTDGIRGVVDDTIDVCLCDRVARAYAHWVEDQELPRILFLATDTRVSNDVLKSAMITAFLDCCIAVVDLGVAPIGSVSFCASQHDCCGGIMITASHNPPNHNGIKFFDQYGYKMEESQEKQLEAYMDKGYYRTADKGRIVDGSGYLQEYYNFIKSSTPDYNKAKILVDCGNGAVSRISHLLQDKIEHLVLVNTKTDGCTIDVDCGALYPDNLYQAVVDNHCDIGLAFESSFGGELGLTPTSHCHHLTHNVFFSHYLYLLVCCD